MKKYDLNKIDPKKIEEDINKEIRKENLKLVDKIQKIRTPFLDKVMVLITKTGNGGTIWLLTSLFMYVVLKQHNQAFMLLTVISVCAVIVNFVVKDIFDRDRPCDINQNVELLIKRPMGSSLPSAHTATSFACAFTIAMINPTYGVIAYIWASLIGFSRTYLYVHFPSDVVFGIISGTLIGAITFFVAANFIPF